MKKVMMIAALAAALVSCQSKGTQNNDTVAMDESVMAVTGNDSSAVAVYEGILPAADGPGIQYVLSVDSVGLVSGECLIIRGEVIDSLLVGDNDRFLSFRRETVSDSIVIHPKNQPVVSPERDLHLIIDILYYVLLIERRGYFLVYRGLRHFQDFRVSTKYLTSL